MPKGILFWQFVIMSLEGVLNGIMLELMFEPKRRSWKWTCLRLVSFWIMMALIMYPEFAMHHKMPRIINVSLYLMGYSLLSLLFFRLRRFDLTRGFILYILSALPMELIMAMLFPGIVTGDLDYARDEMMNVAVLTCIGSLAIRSFLGWVVGRRRNKEDSMAVAAMIVMAGMMVLVLCFAAVFVTTGNDSFFKAFRDTEAFSLAAAVYLFMVIFYFLIRVRWGKREMDLYKQMEMIQSDYYQCLEKSQNDLARLRHDFKNIILTAEALIENGESQKAKQLLNEVSLKFKNYQNQDERLDHPLNTVLTRKTEQLEASGIRLMADLQIDNAEDVQPMDFYVPLLLMVDHAALKLENCHEKIIRFSAVIENGILECQAHIERSPGKSARSNQLRIMIDHLASKVQGSYQIKHLQKLTRLYLRLPLKG